MLTKLSIYIAALLLMGAFVPTMALAQNETATTETEFFDELELTVTVESPAGPEPFPQVNETGPTPEPFECPEGTTQVGNACEQDQVIQPQVCPPLCGNDTTTPEEPMVILPAPEEPTQNVTTEEPMVVPTPEPTPTPEEPMVVPEPTEQPTSNETTVTVGENETVVVVPVVNSTEEAEETLDNATEDVEVVIDTETENEVVFVAVEDALTSLAAVVQWIDTAPEEVLDDLAEKMANLNEVIGQALEQTTS